MKANQAKMQYGSAGVGSGTHLPCALLNFTLGVDITMVPYRGENPALQDVIGDRIDYMCTTIQSGAAQAQARHREGHRRDGAAARRDRAGHPDHRRAGPCRRRSHRLERLLLSQGHAASRSSTRCTTRSRRRWRGPTSAQKMESLGLEILPPEERTPAYMAKFLPQDIERWGKVIKAAGISVD